MVVEKIFSNQKVFQFFLTQEDGSTRQELSDKIVEANERVRHRYCYLDAKNMMQNLRAAPIFPQANAGIEISEPLAFQHEEMHQSYFHMVPIFVI